MRNLAILILCSVASLAQAQNSSGYSVPTGGTGLTVFIGSGTTTTVSGAIVTWSGALVNVTANAATYIYVDSTGHVSTSTNTTGLAQPGVCDSGFASQSFPIAKVTANFFQVQTVIDCRTTFNLAGAGSSAITSVFGRTGAITAQAGDYNWSQIGAGSNLLAQTMGSGGNFSPLNIGQVAGSQMWLAPSIAAPSISFSANTGNILGSHVIHVTVTYNSAAGQTLASLDSTVTTSACGTGCSVTVTAPTLPSGYTSYTVYDYDATAGGTTWLQQAASNACVQITGNCVITTVGAGAGIPATITAYTMPPNVQQGTVILGGQPSVFFPRSDGNYYPFMMVDINPNDNNGFNVANGTPMITNQLFMNDNSGTIPIGNQTQAFKNAFFSITHTFGVQTVSTNQDRTIGCLLQNPTGDTTTRYGGSCIQAETDIQGSGGFNGSPDGEVAAGSFQNSDGHSNASASTPSNGIHALRAQQFIASGTTNSWTSCAGVPCITGIQDYMTDLSTSAGAGSNSIAALLARTWAANGVATARQAYTIYIQSPTSAARFSISNTGLYVEPWVSSTNRADRSFFFDGVSSVATKGVIQPAVYLGGGMVANQCALCTNIINNSGNTSIPVSGSLQLSGGSVSTAQLGNLVQTTNFTCTVAGGAGTSYSYGVAGIDGNGNATQVSGNICTVSANATLNSSNTVTISMTFTGAKYGSGYARFDVYRTAAAGTPNTTGFIGSMTCTGTTDIESAIGSNGSACTLVDNGLSASGTAPAANTTGGANIAGDITLTSGKGQHINTQAAANDVAGTFGVSASTTGSITFTRNYAATPVCVLTPQTTGLTSWFLSAISTSGFTVTVAPSGTYTFGYICVGNPN